ncbi:MAG: hypothetical protein Q4A97_12075 [Comamonadaceae bacterium]|nr:hypothetical protein [Comamonadaceae bacterium]
MPAFALNPADSSNAYAQPGASGAPQEVGLPAGLAQATAPGTPRGLRRLALAMQWAAQRHLQRRARRCHTD